MTENKRSSKVGVSFSTDERYMRTPKGVPESPNQKSVDSYIDNLVFMPSPNRPPKIPIPDTLTRRKTLNRSVYSKPKSRFGEQPMIDHNMFDQMSEPVGQYSNSPNRIASNHASPRVGAMLLPLFGIVEMVCAYISASGSGLISMKTRDHKGHDSGAGPEMQLRKMNLLDVKVKDLRARRVFSPDTSVINNVDGGFGDDDDGDASKGGESGGGDVNKVDGGGGGSDVNKVTGCS
ncbi:hypothetical protein Tco_0120983 [Tanacetum coccineum]